MCILCALISNVTIQHTFNCTTNIQLCVHCVLKLYNNHVYTLCVNDKSKKTCCVLMLNVTANLCTLCDNSNRQVNIRQVYNKVCIAARYYMCLPCLGLAALLLLSPVASSGNKMSFNLQHGSKVQLILTVNQSSCIYSRIMQNTQIPYDLWSRSFKPFV